jgi:hypothetical protein
MFGASTGGSCLLVALSTHYWVQMQRQVKCMNGQQHMSVCCQILVLCCSDVPSNSNTAPSTLVAHTFALCHRMLFINMQEEGGTMSA